MDAIEALQSAAGRPLQWSTIAERLGFANVDVGDAWKSWLAVVQEFLQPAKDVATVETTAEPVVSQDCDAGQTPDVLVVQFRGCTLTLLRYLRSIVRISQGSRLEQYKEAIMSSSSPSCQAFVSPRGRIT